MSDQPNKFKFTFFIRDLITEDLDNAPDGWVQTKITYKTDTFYKAVRRSLTAPFKFVRKGAYLLRREVYTYGLAGTLINLRIGKLDPDTRLYNQIYSGRIDASKGEDVQTGYTADCISNDFTVQLDAYDTTKFAFPLTGDDIIEIKLPTLNLAEKCDFIMEASPDFRSNAFFAMSIVNYQQFANVASVQGTGFLAQVTPDFTTTNMWFFKSRIATKIRISGSMGISVSSGHYQLNVYRSSDGSLVRTLWEGTFGVTTQQNFDFDFMTSVAQFETLSLYFLHVGSANTNTGINMQYGTVSLQYLTGTPPTKCFGIRGYDLYKRLLQAMNIVSVYEPAQPVPNQSSLLDPALEGKFKNLVYTCQDTIRAFYPDPVTGQSLSTIVGTLYQAGDTLQSNGKYVVVGKNDQGLTDDVFVIYNSVRYNWGETFVWVLGEDTFTSPDDFGFVQQTQSTPSILFTFKDFIQDIFSLQGGQAAFAIQNGIAILEDLSYFMRSGGGQLNLGTVDTKTKINPATDIMFNSMKGGYKDQQYDPTNAQTEVMSEVIYITDLPQPATQLNIQAVSRADPFGVEITRVTPVDTSSSRSDNDNFMIIVKDEPNEDGSYSPDQMDSLTSFSGVDVSYYNWFITPKQNLLRGSQYLRSVFDKMDGYTIRVSAPKKSTALTTTDTTGRRVSESIAETISAAFGPQIFKPWYFTVNAGLPVNALDLLDNNPFGDIAFTWNNENAKGFPVEINTDEGENSAQSFKLLASPSNNMAKFIR